MSKRTEILRELIGLYEEHSSIIQVEIWQECPNTAARVIRSGSYIGYPLTQISAVGFSKVCYPDKWDADYGVRIAVYKALGRIARVLAEDNNVD